MTVTAYPSTTVRLSTVVLDEPGGEPVDPTEGPSVVLVGVGALAPVVRDGLGLYHVAWSVPADQAPGTYVAQWSAWIDAEERTGYETVEVQATPLDSDPDFDRAALITWLTLGDRPEEYPVIDTIIAAVKALIDALPDAPRNEDGTWASSSHLAALMLAARLYKRRNSPQGIEAFTEGGAVYVSRYDSDVARLLKLDGFTRPRVG